MISFAEGKKVFTPEGDFVGTIKKVYISDFGVHTAVIETIFPEFPQFEVLMSQLKPEKKVVSGAEEQVYVLKYVPIKLKMILEEKKAQLAAQQQKPVEQVEKKATILIIAEKEKQEQEKQQET